MYAPCTTIRRHYYSRAERRQWLEQYADQLESELTAVRERIDALGESAAA